MLNPLAQRRVFGLLADLGITAISQSDCLYFLTQKRAQRLLGHVTDTDVSQFFVVRRSRRNLVAQFLTTATLREYRVALILDTFMGRLATHRRIVFVCCEGCVALDAFEQVLCLLALT